MTNITSKEFSEMLKKHAQETKVINKKKLDQKITKEIKNLSTTNSDRRKILNNYQRFLKKQSGGDYSNSTTKIGSLEYIGIYEEDIKALTKFVKEDGNTPNLNSYYGEKLMEGIKNKEDFLKKIKATSIRDTVSRRSFNTLGYFIDFLNFWIRWVNKYNLTEIIEKNIKKETTTLGDVLYKLKVLLNIIDDNPNLNQNQVPSDLKLNYKIISNVTDTNTSEAGTTDTITNNISPTKFSNLLALDNILSVLTLEKKNQALLVNYNFIQDMSYYLVEGDLKIAIKDSKYTGLSLLGLNYNHYKNIYSDAILKNIPDKPDNPDNPDEIEIYNQVMNKISKLQGKAKGMFNRSPTTIANFSGAKNIPKEIMTDIKSNLDKLYYDCDKIKKEITALKNKLPAGADNNTDFDSNAVKALYHVFNQSALLKDPIEHYYSILNNRDLVSKFVSNNGNSNTKKSANGTKKLGKFVEIKSNENGNEKIFLSDVIFSKIAIGAYDNPDFPNNITKSAYSGWKNNNYNYEESDNHYNYHELSNNIKTPLLEKARYQTNK